MAGTITRGRGGGAPGMQHPARRVRAGQTEGRAESGYTRITFAACRPLSPAFTSNWTVWPSASVLKPSIWIAEKCTNTSSPPSCSMKPYPFASLNHFTFPLAIRSASGRVTCEARAPARQPAAERHRNATRYGGCQGNGGAAAGAAVTALDSIRWGHVQGTVQLPVAEHRANVAAGFLEGDELEELVGVVGAGTLEPAHDGRHPSVVRGHCGIHASAEAAQQLRQVRRAEVEVQVRDRDPLGIERHVEASCGLCRGSRQQLGEPAGASGRQRLEIENALLP